MNERIITSSDGCQIYLDFDLLLASIQFRHQTSNAVLKLTVLGGIDERVDEAVAEHQNRSEVVVPASKVCAGHCDNVPA